MEEKVMIMSKGRANEIVRRMIDNVNKQYHQDEVLTVLFMESVGFSHEEITRLGYNPDAGRTHCIIRSTTNILRIEKIMKDSDIDKLFFDEDGKFTGFAKAYANEILKRGIIKFEGTRYDFVGIELENTFWNIFGMLTAREIKKNEKENKMNKIFTFEITYEKKVDDFGTIQFNAYTKKEALELWENYCKDNFGKKVSVISIEAVYEESDFRHYGDSYGTPEEYTEE